MLSEEEKISILVHLSKIDNFLAEDEHRLILFIADGLGMSKKETERLIESPKPIPSLKNIPHDDKFIYLFNIIRMMKADGKIHYKEIKFCEKIAMNLGYKPGVIAELSVYIYKDPTINSNHEMLRAIADSHLISIEDN